MALDTSLEDQLQLYASAIGRKPFNPQTVAERTKDLSLLYTYGEIPTHSTQLALFALLGTAGETSKNIALQHANHVDSQGAAMRDIVAAEEIYWNLRPRDSRNERFEHLALQAAHHVHDNLGNDDVAAVLAERIICTLSNNTEEIQKSIDRAIRERTHEAWVLTQRATFSLPAEQARAAIHRIMSLPSMRQPPRTQAVLLERETYLIRTLMERMCSQVNQKLLKPDAAEAHMIDMLGEQQQAVEQLCTSAHDPNSTHYYVRGLLHYTATLACMNQWGKAADHARRALPLAQRIGDVQAVKNAQDMLAEIRRCVAEEKLLFEEDHATDDVEDE